MQLRIPPVAGGGLPVGEIVLLLSLMTINYTGVLGRLSLTVAILPLAIWWTFGVGRALFDFAIHGTWALRDAAHVLESLFLLVGFVFAGDPRSLERFFDWLPKLLLLCVLYGLLYPIRVEIWTLSPTITSGTGFEVPIFGSMTNTAATDDHGRVLSAAVPWQQAARQCRRGADHRLHRSDLPGAHPLPDPDRGVRLHDAVPPLELGQHRASSYCLSGFLLGLISLIGLQFEGRLGASFNAEFLVAHFMAIFGVCDPMIEACARPPRASASGSSGGPASSTACAKDPFSLLLGLGYGVALTDFYGSSGAAVREPHNSYVTVVARTGIVGGDLLGPDHG